MSKLRWAQFFWADWQSDTALNLCGLPARGLWMALLCIAAQGEPYGHVNIKGRVPTTDELFDLTAPRGTRRREWNLWMDELERHGVTRRDPEGAIWSPRMSQSGVTSLARMDAANQRWKTPSDRPRADPTPATGRPLAGQSLTVGVHRDDGGNIRSESQHSGRNPKNLHEQNGATEDILHIQKTPFASIESDTERKNVGGLPLQPPEVRNPPLSPLERGDSVISFSERKRSLPHDA